MHWYPKNCLCFEKVNLLWPWGLFGNSCGVWLTILLNRDPASAVTPQIQSVSINMCLAVYLHKRFRRIEKPLKVFIVQVKSKAISNEFTISTSVYGNFSHPYTRLKKMCTTRTVTPRTIDCAPHFYVHTSSESREAIEMRCQGRVLF